MQSPSRNKKTFISVNEIGGGNTEVATQESRILRSQLVSDFIKLWKFPAWLRDSNSLFDRGIHSSSTLLEAGFGWKCISRERVSAINPLVYDRSWGGMVSCGCSYVWLEQVYGMSKGGFSLVGDRCLVFFLWFAVIVLQKKLDQSSCVHLLAYPFSPKKICLVRWVYRV